MKALRPGLPAAGGFSRPPAALQSRLMSPSALRVVRSSPWRFASGASARFSRLAMLLAIVAFALTIACRSRDEPVRDVRLTTGPFATLAQPSSGARPEQSPVRFVLASVLSPDRSTLPAARFASHLTARLGRPVTIVRRRTYREVNDLLRNGHADAGIICAGAYAVAHEEFGLRILAGTVVNGATTYRAYVITRRGSGKARLDDLAGAVFAFSDPLSNTGYRYVAHVLHARGTSPSRFFGRTFFTYSHDNTIRAVRDGIADAGVVDSLVWDQLLGEDPRLANEVEIIDRSDEFPNSPVVVSPRADADLVARLSRALHDMPSDAAGAEILHDLGISGFTDVPESAFDPIVASWRELGAFSKTPSDPLR